MSSRAHEEFSPGSTWCSVLLTAGGVLKNGRKHAIADVNIWKQSLSVAGFKRVAWTGDGNEEDNLIELIVTSDLNEGIVSESSRGGEARTTIETILFQFIDRTLFYADSYYPNEIQKTMSKRPIGMFPSSRF